MLGTFELISGLSNKVNSMSIIPLQVYFYHISLIHILCICFMHLYMFMFKCFSFKTWAEEESKMEIATKWKISGPYVDT